MATAEGPWVSSTDKSDTSGGCDTWVLCTAVEPSSSSYLSRATWASGDSCVASSMRIWSRCPEASAPAALARLQQRRGGPQVEVRLGHTRPASPDAGPSHLYSSASRAMVAAACRNPARTSSSGPRAWPDTKLTTASARAASGVMLSPSRRRTNSETTERPSSLRPARTRTPTATSSSSSSPCLGPVLGPRAGGSGIVGSYTPASSEAGSSSPSGWTGRRELSSSSSVGSSRNASSSGTGCSSLMSSSSSS